MAYPGVHAAIKPDHPAVVMAESGERLTYRQLDARSNQLAHLLRDQGLGPGDHVALFMENQIRFMEVVWAAFRSGLYITAINSHLKPGELSYIIGDCDARVVISSRAKAEVASSLRVDAVQKVERWLMVDGLATSAAGPMWESYETAIAECPSTAIPDERPGTTMYYTSGTTGRPKGVMRALPGNRIDEMVPQTLQYFSGSYRYGPDMVYLSPAPMYHAAPLAFSQMVHRFGGTLVIMERFDPTACLANIDLYSVTHGQFVPTMFIRMLKLDDSVRHRYDLSSLEVAVHAAAPCPVSVKRQMIDWWGPILTEYYAGSEGNGNTVITSEEWLQRPGSVGRPRRGQVHICDPKGNDLPAGEIGGVYFSGGGEYQYYKAPDKTAAASLPGGRTTLGDMGYVDEAGYLYLTGRQAHTIISGGVNIYPREIEDVLITHPAVLDVAAFGLPHDEMGEEVAAAVQLVPGVAPTDSTATELIDFCRQQLASYKCPTSIMFESELPRLPTGKMATRLLTDRHASAANTRQSKIDPNLQRTPNKPTTFRQRRN